MTEWLSAPLGELVDLFDHKRVPLSSKQRSERPGPYPYYGAQGIIDHIDDFIFDGRFILIPEDGENLRSRKLPVAYFADGRFWVNNHAHIVKAKPGIAVDRFVQGALEAMDIGAFVTGAAQPKLSQANLRQIPIRLPPVAQQYTIASILDALDDLIRNNRRRVEVLEEMARAIYRERFVRFRYRGHEGVPLVDSPLGRIPDGWVAGALGDLATLDRPNIQPRESPGELFDHYSIPAFDDGQRPLTEPGEAIKSGKYLLSAPAVLVSKLNPRIDRVWFAEPVTERRSVTSTELLIIRPKVRSNLEHLYLLARDPRFREQLTALSGGTSGSHQRARPGDFLNLPVTVAPATVVDALARETSVQLRLARQLRRQANKLARLRDLLLPRLVTGQVDVSRLDLGALTEAAIA